MDCEEAPEKIVDEIFRVAIEKLITAKAKTS
jgi:hypothetical protein